MTRSLTRPAQYRLPQWAHEFLAEEAERYGITRTQVIVNALECLRESEINELMAEGYRESSEESIVLAEEGMPLAAEILDSW